MCRGIRPSAIFTDPLLPTSSDSTLGIQNQPPVPACVANQGSRTLPQFQGAYTHRTSLCYLRGGTACRGGRSAAGVACMSNVASSWDGPLRGTARLSPLYPSHQSLAVSHREPSLLWYPHARQCRGISSSSGCSPPLRDSTWRLRPTCRSGAFFPKPPPTPFF
jgi:hypothetical protein